ncbi:hypothetical protein F5Y16DRAFT_390160 [Xylariaceae sp. FL0255]|nr:hypothetical protein F5Y16DRAFT_390160 [Xylariaceae sp. FL0255]
MALVRKEKQAFFEQLEACRNDNDESDILSVEEDALRKQSHAFFSRPAPSIPRNIRRLRSSIQLDNDESLEIIPITPVPAGSWPKSKRKSNTVPETILQSHKEQPSQRHTVVITLSDTDDTSPSTDMAKRKRPPSLQLAPASKQIFRDLSFFYIPNDDVNIARRTRITRAREHGAQWTRDITTATHVIVDKALSHNDITSTLAQHPNPDTLVVVNDRYPSDCLSRNELINSNHAIEKTLYAIPNLSISVLEPPVPQPPESPFPLKPRPIQDPVNTQTSGSSQLSAIVIPSSLPETSKSLADGAVTAQDQRNTFDSPSDPSFKDDLVECIDAVRDDPESYEHLATEALEASGSDDERVSKKARHGDRDVTRRSKSAGFHQDSFMCMKGGTRDRLHVGPNSSTIRLLTDMAEEYEFHGERWRVKSYRQAVATLRRQNEKIRTAKQAMSLDGIGKELAKHIQEIVDTGSFQKLEQSRRDPERKALKTFFNIYGVGIATAKQWIQQGYRTLGDLKSKANLTTNQKIGIEHYDDLLTRIPRAEVKDLGAIVKKAAHELDPDVQVIIGGSYRRGADTSSDIDLIITKDTTTSARDLGPLLDDLVDKLTKDGFLTVALASHRREGGNKWHGCCVLPDQNPDKSISDSRRIWRRIDFLLVPETEIGAALIYFTGNDLFNRSMRLLANKKKMRLNHKALSGTGVFEGRDEKKIFEILGVQWREPDQRWC